MKISQQTTVGVKVWLLELNINDDCVAGFVECRKDSTNLSDDPTQFVWSQKVFQNNFPNIELLYIFYVKNHR